MKKLEPSAQLQTGTIEIKLNAILAVLLRLLNEQKMQEWKDGDKKEIVKLLIDIGLSNEEIAIQAGMAYGSVANIRSKVKSKSKKK